MNLIKSTRPRQEITLLGQNGTPLTTEETIKALFERHFPGSTEPTHQTEENNSATYDDIVNATPFITEQKVRRALNHLAPSKLLVLTGSGPSCYKRCPSWPDDT